MLNSQLAFTCTVCYFILEPVQLLHCSNNSTKENKGFRYAGRAKQGPGSTFQREQTPADECVPVKLWFSPEDRHHA